MVCLFSTEKHYIIIQCLYFDIYFKSFSYNYSSKIHRQVLWLPTIISIVQFKQKACLCFTWGLIKTCERLCFQFRLMINLPKSITETNLINEYGSTDPSSWKWPRYDRCVETPCNQAAAQVKAWHRPCTSPVLIPYRHDEACLTCLNSPELSKLCPLSWASMHAL